jgi:hypothetical protein
MEEGMRDVVHNRCADIDCNRIPGYGFIRGKPLYCRSHALMGMINVTSKKKV